MAENCIFCRIVSGSIPSACLYQDDHLFAFLDINPAAPGHTLLIPKAHFSSLESCPSSLLAELVARLVPLAKAVVTAVQADGYNIVNNSGPAAGQVIDHLHFHILPRKAHDLALRFGPTEPYPPGHADQIALRVKSLL